MAKRRSITGLKKKRKAPNGAATTRPREISSNTSRGRGASATRNNRSLANSSDVTTLSSSHGRTGVKPRQPRSIEGVDDISDTQTPRKFAALKPRFRYINQDVIKTKWEVLPEHVQRRVQEILVAGERPVIARLPEETKRIEAQAALGAITKTLVKRLPRMPFPPKTKEEHFNYEALISKNLASEHRLTMTLHSTALLESEIAKEERLLVMERVGLNELKRNAKAEEKIRSRRTAKRPDVLQRGMEVEEPEDNAASIGLVKPLPKKLPSLEMDLDASLQPLVLQLRSHLESMEGNASQVTGLNVALLETAAVL